MKSIKRITAILLAVIMSVSCLCFSANAATTTIVGIEIVSEPDKVNFYKEDDWKYGVWRFPEEATTGTFVPMDNIISFTKGNGKGGRYSDRGLLDMDGLVVKLTYSNGTTANVAYKATDKGTHYDENIYYGISRDFTAPDTYSIEVYMPGASKYYDTYNINILPYSLGDINGDETVDSIDALMTLKQAVGYNAISSKQKIYADMNNDGIINSIDALMILRKSVR